MPPATPTGDGLSNLEEYQNATDPNAADSDRDGLNDYDESFAYGTDPNDPDSDGDGLSDGDEVNVHGTDPVNSDTDGDGLTDDTSPRGMTSARPLTGFS